ncbi:2-succinyl-5-enolpyruvyl-6-hydroxy-3-cyclohexene-1-carboxylic-acid synthase [Halorarius litoreus]|uniref:2-succinyl-5-enolpyruvyl-6-hydroxy-3- cyclohexene-1-carboxylic-acid synthase n=1 Tax=Halorarius litoreus TaxID=2962676 RepID=UPI0020CB88F6|nr:2-succinyl-5-enolpyruvyl-6-hydroxy-3-cyclohexene-1-carboxylic-acid synthase [Halorarius litoreus]
MNVPNVNTLWSRVVADELAKSGIDSVVLAPGSRSTPLTVAFAEHPDIETFSLLDERSAAFFALGRAKRTGRPTPLVCTSGTALANFHPAVIEAHQSRVPMLLLTADRPPELQHSGANQTIDQEKLFGDSVRHYRKLPEPEAADRKLRSLRTALSRAVATTTGTPPGPVHLDCPFRKPLEPTVETDEVPEDWVERHPLAVEGRDGPFVATTPGTPTLSESGLDSLASAIESANSGLLVCGPADAPLDVEILGNFVEWTGFPVFADPLSGVRFGQHVADLPVFGGYDSWVEALDARHAPDLVVRVGASPTSKPLRKWLAGTDARQVVVDPAGEWREAEFAASDLVVADPSRLLDDLVGRIDRSGTAYAETLAEFEADYYSIVADEKRFFEGRVLGDVADLAPDPSTLFVSNSMPVRDLDRFGRPAATELTVLGNRGASGIDGITSTALGAGSATDDPLVLVTGDLAYYHDMNGLLAVGRCDVDATVVLVNNDGGGIFHLLPIEAHETFEGYFRTPHGLDFAPSADLYGLEFARASTREGFEEAFTASVDGDGTQVIEVTFDSGESHATRDALHERVTRELRPAEQ